MKKPGRNDRILFALAVLVGLMAGLAYASVPLYTIFCRATGLGGTTQQSIAMPKETVDRFVNVIFDANVDPALPWDFTPKQRQMRVQLGMPATAMYHAHNRSKEKTTGTATFNVQPDKAGLYFDKVQCFCFTKQTLAAGADADLAVQFYIDPEMAKNRENDDVRDITLSYTFFLTNNQDKVDQTKPKGNKSTPVEQKPTP